MCENIYNINLNLPQNAEKVLFAEDLVNHSLSQIMISSLYSTAERYRNVIYNAFNPTVVVAVKCLYRRLENEILEEYEKIRMHQPLDGNSFMNYVTSMETRYLCGGFDAEKVLHFCVKSAMMAVRFRCIGCHVGPLAVKLIANALGNFDMSSGGWESVNNIAASYARIYADNPHDTESKYESTSSSGCGGISEALDLAMTPSQGNRSKHVNRRKCAGLLPAWHDSSEGEYSDASSFGVMSTDEACDVTNNDILSATSCLPLVGSSLKTTNTVGYDPLTTRENVSKPGGNGRGSSSSNSVYFDNDEEMESDAFEDNLDVKKTCDSYGRNLAKKRPASSCFSISGFHVQDSVGKNDAALSDLNSVCHEYPSSLHSKSSEETSNFAASPVRKHIAKYRKYF